MIKNLYFKTSSTLKYKPNLFKSSQNSIFIFSDNKQNYFQRNYTMIGQTVAPPKPFADAYYQLCELDYDSVEAFKVLIDKLDDKETKELMIQFKKDHERHIREITEIMNKKGLKDPPTGPDMKQWLTKGKIYLANITGDVGLLKGMLSNEKDLESAYEVIDKRDDKWEESLDMIKRGVQDEHNHRRGIEQRIQALEKK